MSHQGVHHARLSAPFSWPEDIEASSSHSFDWSATVLPVQEDFQYGVAGRTTTTTTGTIDAEGDQVDFSMLTPLETLSSGVYQSGFSMLAESDMLQQGAHQQQMLGLTQTFPQIELADQQPTSMSYAGAYHADSSILNLPGTAQSGVYQSDSFTSPWSTTLQPGLYQQQTLGSVQLPVPSWGYGVPTPQQSLGVSPPPTRRQVGSELIFHAQTGRVVTGVNSVEEGKKDAIFPAEEFDTKELEQELRSTNLPLVKDYKGNRVSLEKAHQRAEFTQEDIRLLASTSRSDRGYVPEPGMKLTWVRDHHKR